MDIALQQLVAGLSIGCVYGLIALGFSITLRGADLVNFAQGELVMLGAFLGYTMITTLQMPFALGFVLTIILTGVFGVLFERVLLRRIRLKKSPLLNLLIATLGAGIAMQTLARIIWGPKPFRYPTVFPEQPILLWGIRIQSLNLWIILVGIVLMALIQFLFQRTMAGISWRAASLDRSTAELMGVKVDRTVALTFGISGALAGAAGALFGPLYFIIYSMGGIAIKAFAASAIGLFSILGTMVGGPLLGAVETLSAGLISSQYNTAFGYGIMIVILLVFSIPQTPPGQAPKETLERSMAIRELLHRWPTARRLVYAAVVVLAIVALIAPLVAPSRYVIFVMTMAVIFVISAIGLQVIVGYTGQISLAQAAFYGIGAYTSALLVTRLSLPVWFGILAAPIVAAALSLLVAPIVRMPGHYLAISTLGFGIILNLIFTNWVGLTGGPMGILSIPSLTIGPIAFDTHLKFYYVVLVLCAATYIIVKRMTSNSRFGRTLLAVRENELAATSVGINVSGYKIKAFIIGSACGGLSGALFAHFSNYITSMSFSWDTSIAMLTMVALGGLGSMPGAVLGALMVSLLPEALRGFAENRMLFYGIALLFFMNFLPGGLVDLIVRPMDWTATRLLRRLDAKDKNKARVTVVG